MQQEIIRSHPGLQISSPSWFGDRIKQYRTFDRFGYFKEEGDALIEETRSFVQICNWEQVLGHCEDDVDDGNDGKEEDKASKSYETITFSLRSLLRTEIKYDDFLKDIKDEQQRVGRCISELSKAGAILTDTIVTGRAARLCGINNQQQNLDLRKLAPDFQFPPDAATVITIAPIPEDQERLDTERVYKREHF
ncbi:hypothetical protein BDB00DRAFT_855304, partial [Zychaea mexicana]|uniref:uncharacterized protein n=1 Tax=Zychaea mexicana TaxID=64656 RepID=UPI0022FDB57A